MLIFLMVILSIMIGSANGANVANNNTSPELPGVTPTPATSIGMGFFEFRCNIEGARVFIDNSEMGTITNGSLTVQTPVYAHSFRRQLRMEAPGYTVYNETLLNSPKVDSTMIVRGNLQVLPLNLTGTLSLAVSPPGGQVSIDDTIAGVVGPSGIIAFRAVKSGNRNLKVMMPGYQQYSEKVYVEANMITEKRITLTPLTTGSIQISSNPSGAQVSINGTPYGVTPVTAMDLEQGTYIIGFSLPGYQQYQSQVILSPGQTIPVSGILQPVPTPSPTPEPTTPAPPPTPLPTQAGLPAGITLAGLLIILSLNMKKR